MIVANSLACKIQDVSTNNVNLMTLQQPNKLTFIYILDSILKNVQGDYIRLFEEKIAALFETAFESTTSMDEKRSLIKMFKIWDLFFQPHILEGISQRLQLPEYVSYTISMNSLQERNLLTDSDNEKVIKFKREF